MRALSDQVLMMRYSSKVKSLKESAALLHLKINRHS